MHLKKTGKIVEVINRDYADTYVLRERYDKGERNL